MVSFEIFLAGLMLVSTLTGLTTEAVKMIMAEYSKKPKNNTLAGIVAAVLSIAVGVVYVVATGLTFSAQLVVVIFALMFLSWLCAMVGYDKVAGVFSKNRD